MSLETVIFDMDGVLVDSAKHWLAVGSEFLKRLIPSWSDEDQVSIHGKSIYDVYDVLCSQYGLELSKEEFLGEYKQLASEIYQKRCSLIVGAKEFIQLLSTQGIELAIVSSTPASWIEMVVKRFALGEYFSHIISSDHVGDVPKPYSDVYVYAIDEIKKSLDSIVAIEDSAKGIKSAKGAGIAVVGFQNDFNQASQLRDADLCVKGFSELSLEKLGKVLKK